MKDVFIDVMLTLMPFMKPLMWLAVIAAVFGIIFVFVKFAFKSENKKSITWSGRIVLVISIFFLAAQGAGYLLNMPPTINFGDSSKFEFILVSFWQIGAALLITGLFIKFAGAFNKTQEI